jgi:hypothetical protein
MSDNGLKEYVELCSQCFQAWQRCNKITWSSFDVAELSARQLKENNKTLSRKALRKVFLFNGFYINPTPEDLAMEIGDWSLDPKMTAYVLNDKGIAQLRSIRVRL